MEKNNKITTENTRIAAIKKSASVTTTVLKILRIVATVGAIICLVCGIVCLTKKDAPAGQILYENGTVRFLSPVSDEAIINGEGFKFINELGIENVMVWTAVNCFCAAVVCALIGVVFYVISQVFNEIKEGDTPFTESIRKKIRINGIIVTILVASESLGAAVIVALSFWCVYCIFGYGMELQKAEDETL